MRLTNINLSHAVPPIKSKWLVWINLFDLIYCISTNVINAMADHGGKPKICHITPPYPPSKPRRRNPSKTGHGSC